MLEEYNKALEQGADPSIVGNPDMPEASFKVFVYKNLILELMDYSVGMSFIEEELGDLGPFLDEVGFDGPDPDGFSILTLKYRASADYEGIVDDFYYTIIDKQDLEDPRDLVELITCIEVYCGSRT